jgi:hypothetical protein
MEGVIGTMIPIFFFGMIAAIVIVPRYFKSIERQKVADTLRVAIEKGQPLPPEIVDAIARDARLPPSPARDIRTGIVWLAVAAGLAAFGVALGFEEPDATFPLIAIACFPGFVGLAFLVLGLINKNKA